eukprot:m.160912 g.160912  ORF g.160912 m.160912 type:complete len:729 (+) comp38791_c0_seq12:54-2240(+)
MTEPTEQTVGPAENLRNLHIVLVGVGSLSLICCVVVFLSYRLNPRLRQHPSQLLFYRTVSDAILAVLGIVVSAMRLSNNEDDCQGCLAPSMIFQFSVFSSSAWYVILAIDLLLAIRNPFSTHKEYNRYYHGIVWASSLATALVIPIGRYHGPNKFQLCWLDDGQCQVANLTNSYSYCYVGIGLYFGPFFLLNILAVSILIFAFIVLRKGLPHSDALRKRVLQHSTIYVLTFAIQWFIFFALWIVQFQKKVEAHLAIAIASYTIQGLSGCLDLVVWMWSGRFRCSDICRRRHRQRAWSGLESVASESSGLSQPLIDGMSSQNAVSAGLRRDAMRCVSWGILDTVSVDSSSAGDESDYEAIRRQKLRPRGHTHVFEFRDFAPNAFHRLRSLQGIQWSDYARSFQDLDKLEDRELLEKFTDGRSGSFFYFSLNSKYIVKTVTKTELYLLRSVLRWYVHHLEKNPDSLLTRVYGLHRVRLAREQAVISLAVMGNIFPPSDEVKLNERYDLKGSSVDRKVIKNERLADFSVTLKDTDLKTKFIIGERKKAKLMEQLRSDVGFLASIGVMDYSLLVGVHNSSSAERSATDRTPSVSLDSTSVNAVSNDSLEGDSEKSIRKQYMPTHMRIGKQRRATGTFLTSQKKTVNPTSHLVPRVDEHVPFFQRDRGGIKSLDGRSTYYFGLIDVLQQYTWSKKMERFLKSRLACKDGMEISAVDVSWYAERFLKRMEEHFE